MDLNTKLDDRYTPAIIFAFVLQLVILFFCGMVLDLGVLRGLFAIVVLAFWVGVGISLFRRPMNPTVLDLLVIRYGSIVFFILAILYAHFVLGIM